jgi:hypothetical protein
MLLSSGVPLIDKSFVSPSQCFTRYLKAFPSPLLGDAADKAANLMGCKSPAVNCPIQTASISDVEQGNELYGARK